MNENVSLKRGDLVMVNIRGFEHKFTVILLRNIGIYDESIFFVSPRGHGLQRWQRDMFEIHKLT